jgi:hypothetical protein
MPTHCGMTGDGLPQRQPIRLFRLGSLEQRSSSDRPRTRRGPVLPPPHRLDRHAYAKDGRDNANRDRAPRSSARRTSSSGALPTYGARR